MSSTTIPTASDRSATQTTPRPGARLINLVVEPAAAFRGIADSSPWALAFIAAVALRFGSLFVFYRPTVTVLKLIGGVLFQIATIAPPLVVGALVVWLAGRAWRVGVTWRTAFSITVHVYVAHTLATIAIASIAGALLPESSEIDLRSPPFTNLASLVSESDNATTWRLLTELDIRSLYAVALLWLGLRGATPRVARPSIAKVIGTIVAVRLVGVLGIQMMR